MTKTNIKDAVLELCAEDDYGVWELYWRYQELAGKDADAEPFIVTLQELVAAKKIVPYDKNKYSNTFEPASLDVERLRSELQEVKAGNITEGMYWFGEVYEVG